MEYREKSGQQYIEPITVTYIKDYIGYNNDDQDSVLLNMIKSARLFVEHETGLSLVSKTYEVEFEKGDAVGDWYCLPMSPVTSIVSVTLDDEAVDYDQKGQSVVKIKPSCLIATGIVNNILAIEFVAGKARTDANLCISRIVADVFNNKADYTEESINRAVLSFDTRRLLGQISTNTSL